MTKLTEAGRRVWSQPFHPETANHIAEDIYIHRAGITYGLWLVGQCLIDIDASISGAIQTAIDTCNALGEMGDEN